MNVTLGFNLVSLAKGNYDLLLALLVAVGFYLYFTFKLKETRQDSQQDRIPGNLGLPFIGETFSFLSATNSTRGCYDFVTPRRLWYGKWFRTRLFGKIHVFIPTTDGAKQVLSSDFVQFNKGYVKSMADVAGKNSLFSVPVERHNKIRRLLSDQFSMSSLSKYVIKIDAMLSERMKEVERSGKSFRLLDFCMTATFDAICNVLMSITDYTTLREIERDCTDVSNATLTLPVMIPGTKYYKGMKARQRLVERFIKIIADRRKGNQNRREDFLQAMLDRDSFPPEEKLDDGEIMDNLLTMMFSGQNTTASAMMWSVKYLDDNSAAQERLREEQLEINRKKPEGEALALEDINQMTYGLKVIKETLRMCNIVLWLPRKALKDCTIDGHKIKQGWHVNIDATYIHYDPDIYKDPLRFNPSRFDEMQKPFSFLPFGYGPRTCLGINMAKVTMLVFLHRLTSGYRWTVDDQDPSLEKKGFIPRLRSGCPITLQSL
ncbi:hypothetical protein MLD38_029603 [Melastoma candidum]|uniref:Uncharacterized protein n=1 Tax=Melastoma candidum TaxID=119954 RepID=A0ACB9N5W4_9MYRT|nr:hypothetical protein MLD38_029603 [Melastoma candidum]